MPVTKRLTALKHAALCRLSVKVQAFCVKASRACAQGLTTVASMVQTPGRGPLLSLEKLLVQKAPQPSTPAPLSTLNPTTDLATHPETRNACAEISCAGEKNHGHDDHNYPDDEDDIARKHMQATPAAN